MSERDDENYPYIGNVEDHENELKLTKEEVDMLWKELMHYHIPYNNPQMKDIVHKLSKFIEKHE